MHISDSQDNPALMPAPSLSVLIVTYNTRELLDGCLRSLRRSLPPDSEIIVIDNASTDDTVEHVRREFPEIILATCDENLGFAAGMNRGITLVQGKFLFFLNPDTLLPRGTVESLIKTLAEHPRAAIAGAQMTYADGQPQPSSFKFPTLIREFWNLLPEIKYFLRLDLLGARFRRNERDPHNATGNPRRLKVESISGAAFLARVEVMRDAGGFDDGFFLYHDERDLCRRLWKTGREVWLDTGAQVIHFDAQFTRYRRSRMPDSPVLEYRLLSMDRLWQKHKSATMHQLWRSQTRGLLTFRCFFLVLSLPFLGKKSFQRISHLWRARKLLKGKSILGRDLEGGWATKRA